MTYDSLAGHDEGRVRGRRTGPGPRTTGARLGAEVVGDQTRFRLFTDRARSCEVRLLTDDGSVRTTNALENLGDGFFETRLSDAGAGTLYDFVLDGVAYPDPYARFLPRGVNGPAMVVEDRYSWRHGLGIARPLRDHVIYELHVGTFTVEGTYAAARTRLQALADLGVTTIELLPLSSFAGTRGWGYDGVAHFAPFAPYGSPDDLRAFVDEAHGLGLSVFLDVVYNHFGPAGNYLTAYSPQYFSAEARNAWGDGPNFRHPVMRSYVLENARYWLTDFRFDGLRVDATHAISDPSPKHILKQLAEMAHELTPRKVLIAEDERNEPGLVSDYGLDGIWADDFHHVAHVLVTHENDGYYGNYPPTLQALADAIRKGWLYEGQIYPTTGHPRGKRAAGLPPEAFIYCLQNHDQVGNRAFGDRWPGSEHLQAHCAMSMVLLFLPMTPLLFMGQEWAATTPFQFFTDHDEELGPLVSRGRRQEFQRFKAFAEESVREQIPDPQSPETFQRSKLNWEERASDPHRQVLTLYKELLRLRREDPVLTRGGAGAAFTADSHDGLLIVRRFAARGAGDEPLDGDGKGAGAGGAQPHGTPAADAGVGNEMDRVLIANLGDVAIPETIWGRELAGRRVILRSDLATQTDLRGPLPAWTAIIAGADLRA